MPDLRSRIVLALAFVAASALPTGAGMNGTDYLNQLAAQKRAQAEMPPAGPNWYSGRASIFTPAPGPILAPSRTSRPHYYGGPKQSY